MKIVIWSDYACPYCHIGEERLRKAIAELGIGDKIEVEYRAFELDPTAPREVTSDTQTRFARKYRMTPEEALAQIERISRAGREEGLDFKYASSQYTSTFDAHRLMKLALSKNNPAMAEKLNTLLFDAYFTKNLRLADPEVLIAAGVNARLKEEEIRTMLASDQFAEQVRADEKAAARRGVHAVPYFWVEGVFSIPGAIPTDQMKDVLREALKATGAQEIKGHVRDPDGCEM